MATHGQGIAWLPRKTALREIAAGTLVPAGDERWSAPLEVRIYHRSNFSDAFQRVAVPLIESLETPPSGTQT